MNKTARCPNCGADVSITSAVCRYCKTPVKPDRILQDDDREKISDVASAMEESLKVASGDSRVTGIAFLLLSIAAVGSFFVYSRFLSSSAAVWVLTAFTAIVFFIAFGALVSHTETRAVEKAYGGDVKKRIDEYLELMNFHRYEFDDVANDILPEKALLRRFLFKS